MTSRSLPVPAGLRRSAAGATVIRRPGLWLAAVVVLAVLLRLPPAFVQGDAVAALPGIHDQLSYDGLAQRVLEGYGFSFGEAHWPATRAGEPTAHWSYLYTLYLAAVYGLLGVQPLLARLIQAVVVGVLHPWLAWRLGRRLGDERTGLFAAGLSAVYLYFVYYTGALLTESFYIVALLWVLDCALRIVEQSQVERGAARLPRHLWVELGLAVGLTVLLRQLFLLFVPFLGLWLLWALYRVGQQAGGPVRAYRQVGPALIVNSLIAGLIVAALILPWTYRNYRAFSTLVPLNTNAGYVVFWGNHPFYGTRFVDILPDDGPSYYELIPKELLSLNEAELDRALLAKGIGFIVDEPGRYLLLSLNRIPEYFKFWPTTESSLLSNLTRVGSFGLALPFMLHGLWLSATRLWRSGSPIRRANLVLLWLFMLVYSAMHLLTWALVRYRLPVDAVALLFAAVSLDHLTRRFSARRERGAAASSQEHEEEKTL